MLPIIQHELCTKHHFVADDEMATILVLAQSLPGVLAVNSATLIGYKLYGKKGAVVCALGVVLPSYLIIVFLANLIITYQDNLYVRNAFSCIRAVVVGMILAAAIKLGKPCYGDWRQMVILAVAMAVVLIWHLHPIFLIAIGGYVGWILTRKNGGEV